MHLRGSESVTFALEAIRQSIVTLAGPEIASFTEKYGLWGYRQDYLQQKLLIANKKALSAWKRFDLRSRDDWGKVPADAISRWFCVDVVLDSDIKVYAELQVRRDDAGKWSTGTIRAEIRDTEARGGRPWQLEFKKVGGHVLVTEAQRYTSFGAVANPTYAPPIYFST
jgi:hypothetical protein